jgi:SagB-type dehydrogenase family enzyme
VDTLLGLDSQREAPLAMVALGEVVHRGIEQPPTVDPLVLPTAPLSKQEVNYPAMQAMHEASSLQDEKEVVAWRAAALSVAATALSDEIAESRIFPLTPLRTVEMPQDTIDEVIIRRGSTRQFAPESISFAQLSTMLDRATRGVHADFLQPGEPSLNELYLIVNAVDDLPSGTYLYRSAAHSLELLNQGDFRRDAGHLGLGQEIPADCSVNVYFLADLPRALERYGNRGYRAAQLEASIMGGKLYLAAYAQRLGASGLTFFDDDVTEFFSPHAAGKSVMFLLALGKSVKRRNGLNVV